MFRSDNPRERENISSYGEMNTPPPGTKKHRLGRLMSGTQDERQERPPAMTHPTDSAYGSSDNRDNIVQVQNDGSIPNTNMNQNLALDRGTGEVFDEDTGDVVTVVTTTTTTTTTTTSRAGKQQQQDVQKDVQTTKHEQPHGQGQSVSTTTGAGPSAPHMAQPHRAATQDSAYASSSYAAPEIPVRDPRRSGEYDNAHYPLGQNSYDTPASPSRHNFSYPSRAAPAGTTAGYTPEPETRTKKSGGRFADLKAAAVGLHGVGETLRGTLNSSIDDRYASKNPEKAAAARAKNAAVMDRGRNEMGGIPQRHHQPVDPISGSGSGYTHQPTTSAYTPQPSTSSYAYQPTPSVQEPSNTDYATRGTLPPDPASNIRGSGEPGSHSAAFGLTPDGSRHLDTVVSPSPTPLQHPHGQGVNDLSSVSNMTSSDGTPGNSLHAPRGNTMRQNSDTAPESVSGHVERGPSVRHPEQGMRSGDDYNGPISPNDSGYKRSGTFSKLFKRKPLGGEATTDGDRKKYY